MNTSCFQYAVRTVAAALSVVCTAAAAGGVTLVGTGVRSPDGMHGNCARIGPGFARRAVPVQNASQGEDGAGERAVETGFACSRLAREPAIRARLRLFAFLQAARSIRFDTVGSTSICVAVPRAAKARILSFPHFGVHVR
jgi:hypothetical protein